MNSKDRMNRRKRRVNSNDGMNRKRRVNSDNRRNKRRRKRKRKSE